MTQESPITLHEYERNKHKNNSNEINQEHNIFIPTRYEVKKQMDLNRNYDTKDRWGFGFGPFWVKDGEKSNKWLVSKLVEQSDSKDLMVIIIKRYR